MSTDDLSNWYPVWPDEVEKVLQALGLKTTKTINISIQKRIGTSKPVAIVFFSQPNISPPSDKVSFKLTLPTNAKELKAKYQLISDFVKLSADELPDEEDLATRQFQLTSARVLQALPFPEEFIRVQFTPDGYFKLIPFLTFRTAESFEDFIQHMNVHFPKVWNGHIECPKN